MPSSEEQLWDPPVVGSPNRLRASRCDGPGHIEFPALDRCPVCGAGTSAVALSGAARLGATTAVLHPPPGGQVDVPYVVGVAEFPEGISVIGLVDATELGAVSRGDVVDTVALEVAPGLVTYGFRPR